MFPSAYPLHMTGVTVLYDTRVGLVCKASVGMSSLMCEVHVVQGMLLNSHILVLAF